MASRILVADDSLTIQKVIGITLANSGYELIECVNEDDLFRKLQSGQFDLILLDFNLSDTKSGYELAKQVNEISSNAALIVMLGTFDSIDEGMFGSCGISDKIIKPFESSKFIKKCRDVLEGIKTEALENIKTTTIKNIDTDSFDLTDSADDLDLWKVDAPLMTSHESDISEVNYLETSSLDPLSSEIEGWGFDHTNILEDKFQKSFPPVIEESSPHNILDRLQTSSSFVQENVSIDEDETDPSFTIPEDLNRSLLSEIENEISPEAFWAVDEVVPLKASDYNDIVKTNLEDITADLTDTVKKFKKNSKSIAATKVEENSENGESDTIIHMDQDELVEKLKISLRPMIEEMVREFCRQNAEKVAWEVIPDLAENLIRKELKEIADSIKH
jgi:DNA-binding response OmpR family regulator